MKNVLYFPHYHPKGAGFGISLFGTGVEMFELDNPSNPVHTRTEFEKSSRVGTPPVLR
jgi:hypothetical protein